MKSISNIVIGIGEDGGMGIQQCSDDLIGTKQLREIKETILDIHLAEHEPKYALCVKPLKNEWIVFSKVTRIEHSEVESRPHTMQHQYVMKFSDFLDSVKTKMDDDLVKEKNTLSILRGFYQEEKWNLFCNLVIARQKKIKIALGVEDNFIRENFMADMYRLLPNDYALNTSMVSAGICPQTLFHFRLVSETGADDLRQYKYVPLKTFLRSNIVKKEYSNLKKLVLAPNKIRDEFYASKHMNPYPAYDCLMSFSAMEHAAKKFLEDKNMLAEPERDFQELKRVVLEEKEMVAELLDSYKRVEKRDKRFEMLLKEILAWRNNEFRMGHEMNFWKLDEIMRNVGVVPFQSEEGYMYDPEKHEEEEILPCDEEDKMCRIVKSCAPGYFFQGKVLLREDVIVYKGGV